MKKIVLTQNGIPVGVKFNQRIGNKIIVAINSKPITIIVLQASDGALLHSYQLNLEGNLDKSLIFDENGYFYISLNNQIYKFKDDSLNSIWGRGLSQGSINAIDVDSGKSQILFAGLTNMNHALMGGMDLEGGLKFGISDENLSFDLQNNFKIGAL